MAAQGNLLTLIPERELVSLPIKPELAGNPVAGVRPEFIPEVPGLTIKLAEPGDLNYEITSAHQLSRYRWAVQVAERAAVPGEPLRGPDMQFLPDFRENLRFRIKVMQAADDNPRLQELQRILCRSSILYYVSTYGWTYDPRRQPHERHIPFVPFEFQKDILTWMVWTIKMAMDGLGEKSRSVGFTWLFVYLVDWLSTFFPGNTSYLTSLREEDVDNKTPDSLFGKLRYQHSRLPEWLRAGWKLGEEELDKKLNLHFPDTGAFIRGQKVESTGGRQGRASVLGADEFAHISSGAEALEAFTELAASKFYFSTPKGMGNAFAQMAHQPGVNKKRVHWSAHPLKDAEWAKRESSKSQYFDDAIWAQEQEIDYAGSVSARVFSQFAWEISPGVEWVHARRDEIVQYHPAHDVYVFIDLGTNDPCSILFAQLRPLPPEYHHMTPLRRTLSIFAEYEGENMTAYCLRYYLNREREEMGYRYRDIIGDMRTGEQRDSAGSTWIKNLRDPAVITHQSKHFGDIVPVGPPIFMTGNRTFEEPTFDLVRALLGQVGGVAVNAEDCPHFVQVAQNWSYPIDKETRRKVEGAPANHDRWSHAGKAFCYGVDWISQGQQTPNATPKLTKGWNFSTRKRRFA